jgi:uncharacterized membrane protein YfhO
LARTCKWGYWQSAPTLAEIEILDPLHKLGGEQQRPVTKISLYFIVTLCRNFWIHPHLYYTQGVSVRCYLLYLLWQACKERDCQLVMFTFFGWCAGVPVWACYIHFVSTLVTLVVTKATLSGPTSTTVVRTC